MMNIKTGQLLASLSATLLLVGCASDPTVTEREFGDSVRQMITAQIYDPATVSEPSDGAIDGTDGPLLEGALEAYRTTVSDQSNVGNEITISVGQ